MLVVETLARIRREFFVKGKSIKEVVRDLGVSRDSAPAWRRTAMNDLGRGPRPTQRNAALYLSCIYRLFARDGLQKLFREGERQNLGKDLPRHPSIPG